VRKVTGNQVNNYDVQSVEGFDKNGNVYFVSNKKSPLESLFYSTNIFKKSEEKLLTPDEGNHHIIFNDANQHFIDIYSNKEEVSVAKYFDNKGKSDILKKAENPYNQYEMPDIEIGQIKAADGVTDLYYRLIKPLNFNENKKYPVVIYVYGGPHTKLIDDSPNWGADRFLLYLAQEGFLVWTLDSRGSSDRGLDFENAIYENLATVCVDDQNKGIEYLKSLNFVDNDRIGVYGWSFGGFLTVSLKLKNADVKVAVAGGPVINWEYYEIMYGERYMNTPANNPDGYSQANLLNYFENLKGKLLIIQGAKDNTVLPINSLTFVNNCIESLIPIDFFIYPDDPHNVRAFKRNHLNRKIFEYFKQNL
jgi:dipeptidyl aminopeptidase/acylaminoacyl peptidase